MWRQVDSGEFRGMLCEDGMTVAPIWKHLPGTRKHIEDKSLVGAVAVTATDSRGPCDLCGDIKASQPYSELDTEPHRNWQVIFAPRQGCRPAAKRLLYAV